jgi:hypothetical protein
MDPADGIYIDYIYRREQRTGMAGYEDLEHVAGRRRDADGAPRDIHGG